MCFRRSLLLLACLFCARPSTAAAAPIAATAPPAAAQLADLVQSWVDRDELVGAELLVLQAGQPLLHQAFGYADRERGQRLEIGAFFAIRSMTKPFTGMAAQILIDEGKLELDAPVARYLPSFDHDGSKAITIRHLLTHRAGFPFYRVFEKPLREYAGGLRELADLAGTEGPLHAPDSRFVYSDIGSDVLGAVVSSVAGQPLETFIRQRILVPLQLADTFPETEAVAAERRDRVPARYTGVSGGWTRYWDASREPLYAFLKGSGGLYSTTTDYARFLQAWVDREHGAARRLLSPEAFARALLPASGSDQVVNTGFPGVASEYGQMWTLYRDRVEPRTLLAFGHSGSDGTHAYAFPEHDLIVCLFTQTRGHETAPRLEAALAHLFLRPNPDAFARLLAAPVVNELGQFTGLFARDNRLDQLGAVVVVQGGLAFEVPGRMLLRLRPTETPDRWIPERLPNDSITFERSGGDVVALTIQRNGRTERAERVQPDPNLPTPAQVRMVRALAANERAWGALLPLRIEQALFQNGAEWKVTTLIDASERSFTEVDLGAAGRLRLWVEGERAWKQMPGADPVELQGIERMEELGNSWPVWLTRWTQLYPRLTVLAEEVTGGDPTWRVRLEPPAGLAVTQWIDVRTGRVKEQHGFSLVPGVGLQGVRVKYEDYRDIEGIAWPHRQKVELPGLKEARFEVRTRRIIPRAAFDAKQVSPPGRQR